MNRKDMLGVVLFIMQICYKTKHLKHSNYSTYFPQISLFRLARGFRFLYSEGIFARRGLFGKLKNDYILEIVWYARYLISVLWSI